MRSGDAAFITALGNAKTDGLVPRRFLYVKAKSRDVEPVAFNVGFWTGDDNIEVTVTDGTTGAPELRTYIGLGTGLRIPKIPRVSDLTIQTLMVSLSQLNATVNLLVRENTVRFAKADIHEGLLSTVTRNLVSAPEIAFLGEIDGDPIETPKAGEEGSIQFEIVSDAIRALTRTNPAKRSYEMQHRRSDDEFGKYSNVMKNIEVVWGE